jgi:hypothetical protein
MPGAALGVIGPLARVHGGDKVIPVLYIRALYLTGRLREAVEVAERAQHAMRANALGPWLYARAIMLSGGQGAVAAGELKNAFAIAKRTATAATDPEFAFLGPGARPDPAVIAYELGLTLLTLGADMQIAAREALEAAQVALGDADSSGGGKGEVGSATGAKSSEDNGHPLSSQRRGALLAGILAARVGVELTTDRPDLQEARALAVRALRADPGHPEAGLALARVCLAAQDTVGAVAVVARLLGGGASRVCETFEETEPEKKKKKEKKKKTTHTDTHHPYVHHTLQPPPSKSKSTRLPQLRATILYCRLMLVRRFDPGPVATTALPGMMMMTMLTMILIIKMRAQPLKFPGCPTP